MKKYDYYYYVAYEYEIKGGMAQSYCECRRHKIITHLAELQTITNEIQKLNDSIKPPVIIFYTLLRKENI